MSKWINERAWTMSVYICYVLGFIVLSVAGYHCAMALIGSTSLFMKAVILICVCLIVALIVSLVFSIFITPISELLLRLLKMLQRKKHAEMVHNTMEEEKDSTDIKENNEFSISPAEKQDKNTLRSQFVARFVTEDHKNEPIYDVIDHVLNESREGAFAVRVIGCATELPLEWLVKKLSSEEMVYYFGEEAICSKGAYNTAMTKFRKNAFKEESYSDTINIMKDRLKQLQNERKKEQTGQ